ncbi:unnamed protein product [Peniophora sp. CBMAI 1063]|nr:unnamed protein product [Peniophora sp. CBMAI 1063]
MLPDDSGRFSKLAYAASYLTLNGFHNRLANNLSNVHLQLGARGTSILFSSGDGDVCDYVRDLQSDVPLWLPPSD